MNGLEALRDLQPPAGIGPWPPAPGWWLLALLALLAVAAALFVRRRWRRHPGLRARRALRRLYRECRRDTDPACYVTTANAWLKHVALQHRPDAAPLHGEDWLRFLEHSGGPGFLQGPGRVLGDGPYRPPRHIAASVDLDALHRLLLHWLRRQSC